MDSNKSNPNITQYVLTGLLIIAAFFIGMLWTKSQSLETLVTTGGTGAKPAVVQPTQDPQQPAGAKLALADVKKIASDKKNLVLGNPNSNLIFVEFSDPSCPYCSAASGKNPTLNEQMGTTFKLKENGGTYVAPVPEMKKLVDQGKAAFVYVYTIGHGNGELGAQALYCANDQGKFWPVHDLLMGDAGYNLMNNTIKNDASKAGQLVDFVKGVVTASSFKTCLESGKYAAKIAEDRALATSFGVNGTPNFFVNDRQFAGAYSFADMQSFVDAALK